MSEMIKEPAVTAEQEINTKNDVSTEPILDADIKVSVIVPIYNACRHLRPAIDSILDQTMREIEVICVDDGSTDTSLDMLKIYQKSDSRIRIVTQTNAGPGIARNNGMRRARGKYIAFLDADDFYEPELLERLYNFAEENELDIAITKYDIYDHKKGKFKENIENEHSKIFSGGLITSKNEYPDFILESTTGAAWNKLFRKSFIQDNNISFLAEAMVFEDVYFTVCALSFAERVARVDDILVHHRIYSQQARVRTFKKYYMQVPGVFLKIKEFLMKGGMYEPLAKGFLNLSCSRCYHTFNLLRSDAKEIFWNMLHDGMNEMLGWEAHEAEDFEKPQICEFSANVDMYTYEQYVRRLSLGRKLDKDKLGQTLKQNKRRKKIRTFFAKIFGKKKQKTAK